jgi:hypothetical protein
VEFFVGELVDDGDRADQFAGAPQKAGERAVVSTAAADHDP